MTARFPKHFHSNRFLKDDVDMETVWDTVQRDLPHLIAIMKQLVPPEQG